VRDAAAGLGFGVSADTPWSGVSACAGRPGCAKALADVQADARAGLRRWPGRVVHWSGCERRCGRSARTEIDVVATATGYRIEGH
jgi:precorrin-3B synthase